MEEMEIPDYVDVLDGGTGGFVLMSYFDAYPVVIFLDATIDGKQPGSISVIRPKFATDFPKALSVHDVGLKDMIEAVYLQEKRPDIHLITISINELTPMIMELTKEVNECIPSAIETILTVAERYKV
jgi:hydrogenase maturation protease